MKICLGNTILRQEKCYKALTLWFLQWLLRIFFRTLFLIWFCETAIILTTFVCGFWFVVYIVLVKILPHMFVGYVFTIYFMLFNKFDSSFWYLYLMSYYNTSNVDKKMKLLCQKNGLVNSILLSVSFISTFC